MKNVLKKVASMSAAVMMMVSVASMGASATQRAKWSIHHMAFGPQSVQQKDRVITLPYSSATHTANCTTLYTKGNYLSINIFSNNTKKWTLSSKIRFTVAGKKKTFRVKSIGDSAAHSKTQFMTKTEFDHAYDSKCYGTISY